MINSIRISNIFLAVLAVVALTGCAVRQPVIEETGFYHINPEGNLESVNRLVVVEFENQTNFTNVSKPLTKQLYSTLVKKHLYEINYLDEDEIDFDNYRLDNLQHADRQILKSYADILKADAVLVGEIIEYKPFPTQLIGLRVKMIDLRSGQVLWSLEQVWDSMDIGVENRIKRYYSTAVKTGYDPMGWEYIRTSPRAYRQFVSFEIATTLPGGNYYTNEYTEYKKNPMNMKDKMLRPVVRFPKTAMETVGMK